MKDDQIFKWGSLFFNIDHFKVVFNIEIILSKQFTELLILPLMFNNINIKRAVPQKAGECLFVVCFMSSVIFQTIYLSHFGHNSIMNI